MRRLLGRGGMSQRQLNRNEFGYWLRTGRVPAAIEYKFNGWHDREDGKFTQVGAGSYFPPGSSSGAGRERFATASSPRERPKPGGSIGGGGSFGGGGATGPGWETPDEQRAREQQTRSRGNPLTPGRLEPRWMLVDATNASGAQVRYTIRNGDTVSSIAERAKMTVEQLSAVNSLSDPNKIQPGQELTIPAKSELHPERVSVRVDRLTFELDPSGRTGMIDGMLGINKSERSRRMQAGAGKPDRRPQDDGGHFIAPRFGGPKATYNHFAQDANFNRGAYRTLENVWAGAQKAGKNVRVRIDVYYSAHERRPSRLRVESDISGERDYQDFDNEKGGLRDDD
jgi:LysM repeat protein